MNKSKILERVLKKIPLQAAQELIAERSGWRSEKKVKKKDDIRDAFLDLARFIRDDEIEDFVEMAVMKKTQGLPAYTYKLTNTDFLTGKNEDTFREDFSKFDVRFENIYTISIEVVAFSDQLIDLNIRLKEYEGSWKTGVINPESLSAVYTSRVTIEPFSKVMTIYTGSHIVQEVLIKFLQFEFNWPLTAYRITEITNQLIDIGNASFKTALLLDLVHNRLTNKGIRSTFNELKFYTRTKQRKDGIKNVAIGGDALLSSQLACEYITTGSDIVYFKVDMTLGDERFTTKVFLKGEKLDILKIVLMDTDNEDLKNTVMSIIQKEYIDMCGSGIVDIEKTKKLLNTIAERYASRDQLLQRTIQTNTVTSIQVLSNLLEKLNDQDANVTDLLRNFVLANQTILSAVGSDDALSVLDPIQNFIGLEQNQVLDEEDYSDEEAEKETEAELI